MTNVLNCNITPPCSYFICEDIFFSFVNTFSKHIMYILNVSTHINELFPSVYSVLVYHRYTQTNTGPWGKENMIKYIPYHQPNLQ